MQSQTGTFGTIRTLFFVNVDPKTLQVITTISALPHVAIDHLVTASREHVNLKPELPYQCHHWVYRHVVLARVARVKNQFVDRT